MASVWDTICGDGWIEKRLGQAKSDAVVFVRWDVLISGKLFVFSGFMLVHLKSLKICL